MPQGTQGGRRRQVSATKKYTPEAARQRFIELVENGMVINAALEQVGYARKTYEGWRSKHPDFAAKVDQARQLRQVDETVRGERMGFADWRRKYLKTETPWHQLQWVDLIEGREPRDLHSSQTYHKGNRNRILINCPPFHGKSICLTVDYSVYRLCMDPTFRILIISAGSLLAGQFLYGIKERLTSPDFIELQKAYAPQGGWETNSVSWTESQIVFGVDARAQGQATDTHEKDPNVQIAGMGSKIYGRRSDLIIVDDGVDETNVSAHAKQISWLTRTVASRLELGGKLVLVGTRIAPVDLYSELMKPENYANGRVPWTHLASPAILEEGKTPPEHKTLWPYAEMPWVRKDPDGVLQDECICGKADCSDGTVIDGKRWFPRWDGVHLEAGPRSDNTETMWSLVYQQKSVSANATFPEHAVQKCTNTQRLCGRLEANRVGHPIGGMHDKYIIGGLDPAIKGFAGIVVIAVDKATQMRYVLTAVNMRAPTAEDLKSKMRELTEHYGIHEWRVEKTGLLQFFTQDQSLRVYMQSKGVKFTEHLTGSNKWDAGFGVSSMASLFGEYDRAWDDPKSEWREITPPLIEFPRWNQDSMKALVHQLITWTPELDPKKVPCDLVMALWFANTGAREFLGVGKNGNVVAFGRNNKFLSPKAQKNRMRVSLADFQSR